MPLGRRVWVLFKMFFFVGVMVFSIFILYESVHLIITLST